MNYLSDSPTYPVFHIYNRANDRQTLFTSDRHYRFFLAKVVSNFKDAAHLLGYSIMPNHFHLLVTPKDPVDPDLLYSDKIMPRLPTPALSEAVRRTLMGFTKAYNRELGLTGSRFQQRTKSKHHYNPFHRGLRYVHYNAVEAQLVDHPGEWGYCSFNEYTDLITGDDRICNVELGRMLLQAGMLH
ncbi:REP element-mobilizing transposase RayT [Lewinella marina]|uniref:Transposase IS200-like domain-containing protein n=1 Tax=Neolewinella marina TaxID=438751 RepID=A0A2G0CJP9_9BACT|nr:hypothetical protein [Neolewinella marina]NJB84631.1 REP element-mobilizing transposase RayT [Neolewinella marina]PHL00195.1 hypothetical protein CGL56_03910 [Neolewinella marina]